MDLLLTPMRRKLLFAALYLSEGAPIGFVWIALPTRLRVEGVAVDRITLFTAMLVWPWALKFLWAPLIDVVRGPRWSYKHWILSAQVLMGVALVPLLRLDVTHNLTVAFWLLLLHALAAATQDAAIDALCIATVPRGQRGGVNGWMQTGMLLGRACMGGGAVLLWRYAGQEMVVAILLSFVWFSGLLLLFSREPESIRPAAKQDAAGTFVRSLVHAARQRNTWFGLLFAGIAGAAYEGVGVVAGPLLIDAGFSENFAGVFLAGPAIAAMIAGSLAGGLLADNVDRRWAVTFSLLWIVVSVCIVAMSAPVREGDKLTALQSTLLPVGLSSMYVGIGLFTASCYTLFMDITRREVAATQFSAFMGATNGCEFWSGIAIGMFIARYGYPVAMLGVCAASLAALPLLTGFRIRNGNADTTLA